MEEELFGSDFSSYSEDDEKEDNTKKTPSPVPVVFKNYKEMRSKMPISDVKVRGDVYLTKLPNFLSVEPTKYDELTYSAESFRDEFTDDEGRVRLKLKIENSMRWRTVLDENGYEIKESNSRMVKWSDGSYTLHVGSEIFDVFQTPIAESQNFVYNKQGSELLCVCQLDKKLTFRPHSIKSDTHKRITISVADRLSRTQKIQLLPSGSFDPEKQKAELARNEKEKEKQEAKESKRKEKKTNPNSVTIKEIDDELAKEEVPDAESIHDSDKFSDISEDVFSENNNSPKSKKQKSV